MDQTLQQLINALFSQAQEIAQLNAQIADLRREIAEKATQAEESPGAAHGRE